MQLSRAHSGHTLSSNLESKFDNKQWCSLTNLRQNATLHTTPNCISAKSSWCQIVSVPNCPTNCAKLHSRQIVSGANCPQVQICPVSKLSWCQIFPWCQIAAVPNSWFPIDPSAKLSTCVKLFLVPNIPGVKFIPYAKLSSQKWALYIHLVTSVRVQARALSRGIHFIGGTIM